MWACLSTEKRNFALVHVVSNVNQELIKRLEAYQTCPRVLAAPVRFDRLRVDGRLLPSGVAMLKIWIPSQSEEEAPNRTELRTSIPGVRRDVVLGEGVRSGYIGKSRRKSLDYRRGWRKSQTVKDSAWQMETHFTAPRTRQAYGGFAS